MNLRLILIGYIVSGNTEKNSEVPEMPHLTFELQRRGKLEISVDEHERTSEYQETKYNFRVNGKDVGSCRVRKSGTFWSELALGREGKVVRNVYLTLEENLGL